MKRLRFIPVIGLTALLACRCGTYGKVEQLLTEQPGATLAVSDVPGSFRDLDLPKVVQDTLVVHDFDGREVIVMNAVRDESSGEMVATETLQAAKVTARFRNVAERCGKVDLAFQVIVPASMQDSRWQVRFHPQMRVLDDLVGLDDIYITGKDYRKAQLRGYEQYERFLRSIVTDSTRFIDLHQLNVFVRRNLPELYALRKDSSVVSDERFASVYGVTEREAVEYYTYGVLVRRNERKIRDRDKMFHKYVKAPIRTDRLRLDSLIVNEAGDFVYNYVQTVATQPRLRKVDILLSGGIFDQDKLVYDVPESDPLTFYISSLSTLVDGRDRYLDQVISRRVDLQKTASIRFAAGRDEVREDMEENAREIASVKQALAELLDNREYDLDSVVVTAHASPEGSFLSNGELSRRRGRSVGRYFAEYMRVYRDSLARERGVRMTLGGADEEGGNHDFPEIRFSTYAEPENWAELDRLVAADPMLTEEQKQQYDSHKEEPDPDRRELAMRRDDAYDYIVRELYPKLRVVSFNFRLHRRDMEKDTIHTMVLDTAYLAGVQAIRDHDYKQAVTLLRPYADFNTAVAYCCLDYNASALDILQRLDRSAEVDYMLALVHARMNDDRSAVECYLRSCRQNPSFIHRGNLDPEISALIRKYDLNKENSDTQ